MQIKQQFYGEEVAVGTSNLFEVNNFLTEKLNLKRKLFANDEQVKTFLSSMAKAQQQAQQAQSAAKQPQPATTAAPVQFPQQQGVTI